MTGQIYEVGVHIAGIDGVSGMLAGISKSVLGVYGTVEKLNKGFKDLNLGIVGAVTALSGVKLGHIVGDLVKANAELQRQVNLFQAAGNSATDAQKAIQAAYKSAVQVPSLDVSEQMKLLRELSSATQDNPGSRAVLESAAKAKRVLEMATGHATDEDMLRLFKFVELRQSAINSDTHKIDPTKFNSEIDWAAKAMIASQGLITSNDLLQFQKQAGPMAKGITAQQLFDSYLAVIEDMNGARTGTGLTAVGRQVFGGQMSQKVGDKWFSYGMLNPEGWHWTKLGHVQIDDARKAIRGYDVLNSKGALAFMDEILRPAMQAHGVTDRNAQNKELYQLGSTETARRLLSVMLAPEQIHLVQERLKQVMGGQEAWDKIFNGGDLNESVKAWKGALQTLKTSLGDAADASPLLMKLAHGVASFANAAKDHPNLAAAVTIGGGAAAGGLQVMGVGAIGVAGYRLITAAGALEAAAVSLKASAAGGVVGGAAAKVAGGAGAAGIGMFAALGAGGGLAAIGVGAGAVGAAATYGAMTALKAAGVVHDTKPSALASSIRATQAVNDRLADQQSFAAGLRLRTHFDVLKGLPPAAHEAGKDAAQALKLGFGVEGFTVAGRSAAQALISGFLGSVGSGGNVFNRMSMHGNSFVPPTGAQKVQIHTHFDVDGRTITKVVEANLVRRHAIPLGANTHDGAAAYTPIDAVNI
jgi:hypothetical protein